MASDHYKASITEKYENHYFSKRTGNNTKRNKQFKLDAKFVSQFISKGNLCDIGCSTGEFVRHLNWEGKAYGMEINEYARNLASDIISFEKNIFTEENFFDLIIFRGTIQHVDEPFRMIKESYSSLKKGGHIIFLATPNSNSIVYKIKGDLGFLDKPRNFYIPGDRELCNSLENFGFTIKQVSYPYLETPYCHLFWDHIKFIRGLFTKKMIPHAFWKSSMNIAAIK